MAKKGAKNATSMVPQSVKLHPGFTPTTLERKRWAAALRDIAERLEKKGVSKDTCSKIAKFLESRRPRNIHEYLTGLFQRKDAIAGDLKEAIEALGKVAKHRTVTPELIGMIRFGAKALRPTVSTDDVYQDAGICLSHVDTVLQLMSILAEQARDDQIFTDAAPTSLAVLLGLYRDAFNACDDDYVNNIRQRLIDQQVKQNGDYHNRLAYDRVMRFCGDVAQVVAMPCGSFNGEHCQPDYEPDIEALRLRLPLIRKSLNTRSKQFSIEQGLRDLEAEAAILRHRSEAIAPGGETTKKLSDGPELPNRFRWKGCEVDGLTLTEMKVLILAFEGKKTVGDYKKEIWPDSYNSRGSYDKCASQINKKLSSVGAIIVTINSTPRIVDLTE